MATPQNEGNVTTTEWPCSFCGKAFTSKAGQRQHERRVCSTRTSQPNPNNECHICHRSFNTYSGLRQHLAKAHVQSYNAELQTQASSSSYKRWSIDEEKELAELEAAFSGETETEIIDRLSNHSTRSREAIKKRRQLASYQALVTSFRALPAEQSPPSSPHGNDDISRLDLEIVSYINSLPTNSMEAEDLGVIECIRNHHSLLPVINSYYDDISIKFGGERPSFRQSYTGLITALGQASSNRKRKQLQYVLAQKEFKSNRSNYAERLLDNKPWSAQKITPPSVDLLRHYQNTFGLSIRSDLPNTSSTRYEHIVISHPITTKEIASVVKSLKSNAPGPDGITKAQLRNIPTIKLAILYNAILIAEDIPDGLKLNSTALIPKTTTELDNAKNWRPITISSTILRCFNKIMAARLGNIELEDCQRGFSKIDGCFANTWTIESLIKHHRIKGIPLTLISLDLTAAFDSVPHDAIARALNRVKTDKKYINLVRASNSGCSTNITCNGTSIGKVDIKRGVRQGDPASPIHFNIFMDELICMLNSKFSGIEIDGCKICCLAYADDFVLVAKTPEDARRMLNSTSSFLLSMCMSLNAKKCSALVLQTVPAKKKVYVDTNASFLVGAEAIPLITTDNTFKYLGRFYHFRGLMPSNCGELFEQLVRVRRSPLKPAQKMTIIREYLIPRFIDHLQQPNISAKILKDADRKIRTTIRHILHLNAHCHNSILYAPIRNGGLGIFNFTQNIPVIITKRVEKLSSANMRLNVMLHLSNKRLAGIKTMIKQGLETKSAIQSRHAELLERSFSGNGISQVRHSKTSYSFITDPPKFWTGEDYVRSIQLRYNLLPCLGIPSNPPDARFCRSGCGRRETNSHILQRCPVTHTTRITRHNFVVKRLSSFAAKKGWTYMLEPNIRCSDGNLKKPDLIMYKNNTLIVSDVGINWEGPLSLDSQYNTKLAIYSSSNFISALQERFPEHNIYILPLIVGARGIWCKQNKFLMHHLRLTSAVCKDIITTTLKGSIISHKSFMRFVWRTRPT